MMTTPGPSQVSDQGVQVNLVRRCPLAHGSQTLDTLTERRHELLDQACGVLVRTHVLSGSKD